jgi:hypothetical protein
MDQNLDEKVAYALRKLLLYMSTDFFFIGVARVGAGITYGNLPWDRDYDRCGNSSLRKVFSWRSFGVDPSTFRRSTRSPGKAAHAQRDAKN